MQAGLNHVGSDIKNTVRKLNKPFSHPIATFKSYNQFYRRNAGLYKDGIGAGLKVTEGKASKHIADHVHPTFESISHELSTCVLRYQSLIELSLFKFGGVCLYCF